ncbi:MAG: DUF6440 family protein [Huintestinicola sp.]
MAKKEDRFVKNYSKGGMEDCEIWVDIETGVNYFFHFSGYAGGLCPLLDRDGNPVVSSQSELEDLKR